MHVSVGRNDSNVSATRQRLLLHKGNSESPEATPVKKQRPVQPPEQLQPTEQPRHSTLQTQGLCHGLLNSVLKH